LMKYLRKQDLRNLATERHGSDSGTVTFNNPAMACATATIME
jgi:hypothetical protein